MKKYVKPELFYERYELSVQIAACNYDLNAVEGSCGFVGGNDSDWPGGVIISGDIGGCTNKVTNEQYCYYSSTDGRETTFAS